MGGMKLGFYGQAIGKEMRWKRMSFEKYLSEIKEILKLLY
jgi:hypothetical protein